MRGQSNTTESAPGGVSQFTASSTTGTFGGTPALPANKKRSYAVICNTDATTDVYLARGVGARAGYGILLKAGGGSYEIQSTNLFLGDIYAATASLTALLSIEEDI